jgi:hypothetical protein
VEQRARRARGVGPSQKPALPLALPPRPLGPRPGLPDRHHPNPLPLLPPKGVLWSISPRLVLFLVGYAVLGTAVTTCCFGRLLMRLQVGV